MTQIVYLKKKTREPTGDDRVSFWSEENVLKSKTVVIVKLLGILWANFMYGMELYLNKAVKGERGK